MNCYNNYLQHLNAKVPQKKLVVFGQQVPSLPKMSTRPVRRAELGTRFNPYVPDEPGGQSSLFAKLKLSAEESAHNETLIYAYFNVQ